MTKVCNKCDKRKPLTAAFFEPCEGGFRNACRDCRSKSQYAARLARAAEATPGQADAAIDRELERQAAQRTRLASDHAPLKPEDFDADNEGRRDPNYARNKRQEFSTLMGEVHDALRRNGGDINKLPTHLRRYALEFLPEQERRTRNRRTARSVNLQLANEALFLAQVKEFAAEYLHAKVTPIGYAARPTRKVRKRSVVALWSDFHLGSNLSELDNPLPFGAVQEARRLEQVVCQVRDYKPQHRDVTKLVLLIAGDMIEGKLHDLQDGAPMAEQVVIFWRLVAPAIGVLAGAFPEVEIHFQVGNHGRNKARHPGRATSSKWDSIEWMMYQGLASMVASLPNVTCHVPTRPWSLIDLHGHNLLLTHSDTEVKIRHPGKQLAQNASELARINSINRYGKRCDAFACGHWHSGIYVPGRAGTHVAQVYNGMLVPPQGYARGEGFDNLPCGQFVWEAVEGHPVGDVRFLAVDERTDADESLGKMIKPFRITDA